MGIESVSVKPSFTGKQKVSYADNFLNAMDKVKKNQQKGDFFSRTLWSSTVIYPTLAGVLGYEFYGLHKISKLEKQEIKLNLKLSKRYSKSDFLLQ